MPKVIMPDIAPAGLPPGVKDSVRADFRISEFEKMIERGYRLVWRRASRCPCVSTNTETDQPDPNCPVCFARGWLYFGPPKYTPDANAGVFSDVQLRIMSEPGSVVIRGIMTGISAVATGVDKVGPFIEGVSMLTVRAPNKLGYYDKIVSLDSEIAYSQVLKQTTDLTTLKARYPITAVNLLATLTRTYQPDADFTLKSGIIQWERNKAPPAGTPLTLHYLCHPTWIVMEHPRSVRAGTIKRKVKAADLQAPIGNYAAMPIQAVVKYEFLAFSE